MTGAGGGGSEAAREALQDLMEGPLYSLVRFGPDDFEVLYVSEETYQMYPDETAMVDHFERLFDYVGIDFAEKALFTDVLLSGAGTVRYMTTALESVKVVRVYDDSRGVFLAVAPAEPVPPLVDVVEDTLF